MLSPDFRHLQSKFSFLVSLRKEFHTQANDHDSEIEVSKYKKFYCNW